MKKLLDHPFFKKIYQLYQWISEFRVGLYAAHASFFIVLSLFPALVLLLGLLRHTGLDANSLLSVLEGLFPAVLMPLVSRVIQIIYMNTSATVLSISAIGALWSASRGMYGLVTGLNAIYGAKESRGGLYTRLVSVGYMFAFFAMLLLTLVLNVYSHTLIEFFCTKFHLPWLMNWPTKFNFLLPFVLEIVLFTAMYLVFPNQKIKFLHAFPGAVFAAVGWLIFSKLYSVYVIHFSGLTGIYDSLYSMALGMLWLYCCISIVFFGGVLNHCLIQRKNSEKF